VQAFTERRTSQIESTTPLTPTHQANRRPIRVVQQRFMLDYTVKFIIVGLNIDSVRSAAGRCAALCGCLSVRRVDTSPRRNISDPDAVHGATDPNTSRSPPSSLTLDTLSPETAVLASTAKLMRLAAYGGVT